MRQGIRTSKNMEFLRMETNTLTSSFSFFFLKRDIVSNLGIIITKSVYTIHTIYVIVLKEIFWNSTP